MSFGTNTSGYREHEMRRQSPVLIGVLLSQKTDDFETHETAGFETIHSNIAIVRADPLSDDSGRGQDGATVPYSHKLRT